VISKIIKAELVLSAEAVALRYHAKTESNNYFITRI
jgi:hypothetical protein